MDNPADKIRVLRTSAQEAVSGFKREIRNIGRLEYDHVAGVAEQPLTHDNVRVIEADCELFVFTLEPDKHQIVVALVGKWTMKHGDSIREMAPPDTVKVPMNPDTPTVMIAEEPGAKFVYIQFKQ